MTHDLWVEVDLAALKHNLQQVKSVLPAGVKLMAVVKGNGFGHGYVEPSRAFIEAGADYLAVTRLDEALIMRDAGITAPILLFAPIQAQNAEIAIDADLDMTIADAKLATTIADAASKMGKTAKVHIKVDTGMGRLGLQPSQALDLLKELASSPSIIVAGIYTHFATAAESSLSNAQEQLMSFQRLIAKIKNDGLDCGLVHAANSAAILRLHESQLDMVRPGTLLYGQYPSQYVPRTLDLKPTWKLKARICEIKDLPKGSAISYGREFIAKDPIRTAVVPIGYADGFTLVPEGPIYRQSPLKFAAKKMKRALTMELNGCKAPVVGRIAMQMTVIDVTGIEVVRVGDEVTVPAMRIPTSALIPRIYVYGSS